MFESLLDVYRLNIAHIANIWGDTDGVVVEVVSSPLLNTHRGSHLCTMPNLLGLPNEVLELAIGRVLRDNFVNFSSACKVLRRLARQNLQEHCYFRQQ